MSIDYDNTRSIDDDDNMLINTSNILSEDTNPKTLTFDIKVNVAHNLLYPDHDSPVDESLHRGVHVVGQGASTTRAVGEFPSSNNIRLQNLVESQLEITKTKSCLISLSAKFALNRIPFASHLGLLIYLLLGGAKDDQQDLPGDKILATDRGARGRMTDERQTKRRLDTRITAPVRAKNLGRESPRMDIFHSLTTSRTRKKRQRARHGETVRSRRPGTTMTTHSTMNG
ncbi:hypothetical protein F2Q70_00039079 [Brassica cretica]|uniref:Uncharacterized protein n=1 Tax=Brassica cretica TaxID=69181 RepID=A0A8S9K2J3_BRACR|nr:hypothetical protein F2Q70_00039079 [Brassica cretica]